MSKALNDAKLSFSHWHKRGPHKGRASNHLKNQAVSLLEDYPVATISEALKIPRHTLEGWKSTSSSKNPSSSFVALADLQKTPHPVEPSPELSLTLPHNLKLSLPSQPVEETVLFIRALVEAFSTCSI